MRTLNSLLASEQTKTTGRPTAQVIIDDRFIGVFRPRWTLVSNDDTIPDGQIAICATYDGAILRARVNPTTSTIYIQRITDPDTISQWTTWTSLATGVSPTTPLTIAWDGTSIQAIIYVLNDNRTIACKQSTNNGQTWSAETTVTTLATGHSCTGLAATLNAGSGTLYCIYADNDNSTTTLYTTTRSETGSTWTTPTAWDKTATTCNGIAVDGTGQTLNIVAALDNSLTLYRVPIDHPESWGVPNQFSKSDTNTITYKAPSIALSLGQHYYIFFIQSTHIADTVYSIFATPNWTTTSITPRPYSLTTAYGAQAMGDGINHYLCTARTVYKAPAWTASASQRTDVSDDVLSISLIEHLTDPRPLTITLRNDDGRYATELGATTYQAIKRHSQISVRLGYTISGTRYVSYYRPYWITNITHNRAQGQSTITIQATDGWGICQRTRAHQVMAWQNTTVMQIATTLLQGLGFAVTNDGNAIWDTTISTFTILTNTPLSNALRTLLRIVNGSIIFRADSEWYDTYPSATAYLAILPGTSRYTFGTSHTITSASYETKEPQATHTIIANNTIHSEAIDWTTVEIYNADETETITDRRATTQELADTIAQNRILSNYRNTINAVITTPPHVGLETGDNITINDTIVGIAQDYMILQNHITLDKTRGIWQQTMTLTAPA